MLMDGLLFLAMPVNSTKLDALDKAQASIGHELVRRRQLHGLVRRAVARAVHRVDGVDALDFVLLGSADVPKRGSFYPTDLAGFIKYLDKVAVVVVNSPMLARRPHHSPRRKSFPCIALRTLFRSWRSFSAPRPFFSTTSALFSQNARVAYPPASTFTSAPFRLHRHPSHVPPLSPVGSVRCP